MQYSFCGMVATVQVATKVRVSRAFLFSFPFFSPLLLFSLFPFLLSPSTFQLSKHFIIGSRPTDCQTSKLPTCEIRMHVKTAVSQRLSVVR